MSEWNPIDNNDNNKSESDDEEYDGPNAFKGRDAIIFLIDAYLSETNEIFKNGLDLIQEALLSGLLTREKDLIGIVFCNTKHSPDPKDISGMEHILVSKNTAIFLPLKQLSKESVEYYLNFINFEDIFDFKKVWDTETGSFSNALRLCTNMFKQSKFKLSTSTIIYLTDRDCPHGNDKNEFQNSIQKAKDLEECDIDFIVLPLIETFDYDKFFKEFLCMIKDIELDEFVVPNIEHQRKMIANRNLKQNHKANCLAHLKWNLGEGVDLSVAMYNYYRKSVYPRKVKLLKEDHSIIDVKRVNKISLPDPENDDEFIEKYLKPGDERKVLYVGGERIDFTCDEFAKMRSPLLPGIRLLGFKSNSTISVHRYIKTSSFLYPDDNIIEGSTILFRALWEKCLEKEKMAICVMVSRRKTSPRFVALEPIESKPNDLVKRNDVFRIVYLPFRMDYRNLDLTNYFTQEVPEEGVNIFEKIIKKLKIKYTPDTIRDPFLEVLHANLIGTAFDIDKIEQGDGGMPDVDMQDQRIEEYITELTQIFGEDLVVSKRPNNDENIGERAPKAQKIIEECPSTDTIQQLLSSKMMNSLTVKQLRNYLQAKNVSINTKLTKPLLIQKVEEFHA